MSKTAIILFNLGGPDSLDAVRPFLYNLFSDPAILRVPGFIRPLLAWFISKRRTRKAKAIYQHLGGKSPILENTQAQAEALEAALKGGDTEYKVFVCMRYWHPMSEVVAKNVKAWAPDHVVLLPLYPQFSTATTASSFKDWKHACDKVKFFASTSEICCYPNENNLIAAHAKLIRDAYWRASESGKPRILFSAHGLPEKVINDGDPYAWQVKETAMATLKILSIEDADYMISYQSRVGPVQWIGPYTEDEIRRAGREKTPIVVVPIAFVSEHSETLVELDIEYRKLAEKEDVPSYQRVPAIGTEPFFIEGLADMCKNAGKVPGLHSFTGQRLCPRNFEKCMCGAQE